MIPLRNTDPAEAVLLIEKMFQQGEDTPVPGAPIVDGTMQPRQLVVRGTQAQIEQIRTLLRDMGEDVDGRTGDVVGSREDDSECCPWTPKQPNRCWKRSSGFGP